MAESELFCVRVATLLRNKYASILRVMSLGSTCQNCQKICFIILDIFLSLNNWQGKNIDIVLAITLDKWLESNMEK